MVHVNRDRERAQYNSPVRLRLYPDICQRSHLLLEATSSQWSFDLVPAQPVPHLRSADPDLGPICIIFLGRLFHAAMMAQTKLNLVPEVRPYLSP